MHVFPPMPPKVEVGCHGEGHKIVPCCFLAVLALASRSRLMLPAKTSKCSGRTGMSAWEAQASARNGARALHMVGQRVRPAYGAASKVFATEALIVDSADLLDLAAPRSLLRGKEAGSGREGLLSLNCNVDVCGASEVVCSTLPSGGSDCRAVELNGRGQTRTPVYHSTGVISNSFQDPCLRLERSRARQDGP
jgi:hypothetical protein